MKLYRIENFLVPCSFDERSLGGAQYVAVLTMEEWRGQAERFDLGIDMEPEPQDRVETRAIVNFDSLTGSFSIPDRENISGPRHSFAFALDEKGLILIDDEGYAAGLVEELRRRKKWRLPGMERVLYDLLEEIIAGDLPLLERMEDELDRTERRILEERIETIPTALNDVRGDLLDLRVHYEQLIDLGQELEENENGFFKEENLRYFRLFTERVSRLQDSVTSLRDYVVQLRDLVQSQLSVRQNKIMTLLTVVTAIFMPLTLITGWYGMNFRYMPELDFPWAYPAVGGLMVVIVVVCLVWFKKKKWM